MKLLNQQFTSFSPYFPVPASSILYTNLDNLSIYYENIEIYKKRVLSFPQIYIENLLDLTKDMRKLLSLHYFKTIKKIPSVL